MNREILQDLVETKMLICKNFDFSGISVSEIKDVILLVKIQENSIIVFTVGDNVEIWEGVII